MEMKRASSSNLAAKSSKNQGSNSNLMKKGSNSDNVLIRIVKKPHVRQSKTSVHNTSTKEENKSSSDTDTTATTATSATSDMSTVNSVKKISSLQFKKNNSNAQLSKKGSVPILKPKESLVPMGE